MSTDGYQGLGITRTDGIALVTFKHPPINLLDLTLLGELDRLEVELRADDATRVVVFESADPEFFLAHGDLAFLLAPPPTEPPPPLNFMQALYERYRSLPQVTIGKLAGRARGGGAEFLLALDLRFASAERAWLGFPEVSMGVFPGGGGTQLLPLLTGRARALEIILGADGFDAELAARYGWVNRALPEKELDAFVSRLARRIASFPATALRLAKQAVDAGTSELRPGIEQEWKLFQQAASNPVVAERTRRALEAGAQTRTGELNLEHLLAELR